METTLTTKIILIIILLHFVVGFGYLVYKLSGKPKDNEDVNEED